MRVRSIGASCNEGDERAGRQCPNIVAVISGGTERMGESVTVDIVRWGFDFQIVHSALK
jgi:hypothetical protein